MTGSSRDTAANQRWLITFADLAAVLFAFFVMLFAMAEVDTDRWNGAVNALSRRLYAQSEEMLTVRPQAERNVPVVAVESGQSLTYLAALLERQLAKATGIRPTLTSEDDRIVVSLATRSFFVGSEPILRAEGRQLAFGLAGVLAGLRNQVAIVSHTRTARQEALTLGLAQALAFRDALQSAGFVREMRTSVRPAGATGPFAVPRIDILVLDERDRG